MWNSQSLNNCKSLALLFVLLVSLAATTSAQEEPMGTTDLKDPRWSPWIGCWDLSEESVNQQNRDMFGFAEVCLAPTSDGEGVKITTLTEDEVILEETFIADGVQRGVDEPGCEGWQSAEWSQDGRRLFLFSDTICGGDVHRTVTGVSLLVPGGTWVDIQSIVSGARRELIIRRYYPAGDEPSSAVFARLSIDNVIEAANKIDSEAVEAAVIETGSRLHIDSRALLDLAGSNVSPELIDLMVAMSFPDRFRVSRRESNFSQPIVGAGDYAPIPSAEYHYGYYYPFYYAPFGYYSYWYSTYPGYYNVTPDVTPQPSGGRVVNNRGYTKVSRTQASTRGGGGGGGYSAGDGSSSSGSGSVGQGGYSRGGGASSRTAKPKNDL